MLVLVLVLVMVMVLLVLLVLVLVLVLVHLYSPCHTWSTDDAPTLLSYVLKRILGHPCNSNQTSNHAAFSISTNFAVL